MRKAIIFALLIFSCHGQEVLTDELAKPSNTSPNQNIQNDSFVGVIQSVRAGSKRDILLMKVAKDHPPAVEILISLRNTKLEKLAHGKHAPAAKADLAPGAKVEINGAQVVRVQHFLNTWTNVWMPSSRSQSGRLLFRPTVSVLVVQASGKPMKTNLQGRGY